MAKIIDLHPYDVVKLGTTLYTLQEYDPEYSWGIIVEWTKPKKDQYQYILSFNREVELISLGANSEDLRVIKRINSLKRKKLYLDFKTLLEQIKIQKEKENGNDESKS